MLLLFSLKIYCLHILLKYFDGGKSWTSKGCWAFWLVTTQCLKRVHTMRCLFKTSQNPKHFKTDDFTSSIYQIQSSYIISCKPCDARTVEKRRNYCRLLRLTALKWQVRGCRWIILEVHKIQDRLWKIMSTIFGAPWGKSLKKWRRAVWHLIYTLADEAQYKLTILLLSTPFGEYFSEVKLPLLGRH